MIVANNDLATTTAATPVAVDVLANDTLDGNPVAVGDLAGPPVVVTPPSNGTATVNPDGTVTYTPNPGFCGTDTFEYEIAEPLFTFVAGLGEIQVAAPEGSIVDWGDGSPLETTGAGTGLLQHTYATAGPHVGTVEQQPGTFNRHIAGVALLEVVSWGTVPLLGAFSLFATTMPSSNLTAVPSTAPPGVTDMTNMFWGATAFNQDISGWDTSSVTSTANMFRDSAFNQPIGGWDTSNVTAMNGMFSGDTSFNQPIGGWDVSNVASMGGMFNRATSFNQPIGGWDVSNVTIMNGMFWNATAFNQDISGWDTSNVTLMHSVFRDSVFNQDISGWDTSNVTLMDYMFRDSAFNQDLSAWCVEDIATEPTGFATNTPAWTLPKPNWGAPC